MFLIPPPTVTGINIFLTVFETNFDKLFVPYKVATLSRYKISSAPLS